MLAFLLIALALAGLIETHAWTEPIVVWVPASNLSNAVGNSTQATMALDPATGQLFVAWVDAGVAARDEILGRRWDESSQSWEPGLSLPAENLSQSEWADSGPCLFFGGQGAGLLLWTRRYSAFQGAPADGTDLVGRVWDGTGWSGEAILYHNSSYLPSSYGYGLIPVNMPDSVLLFVVWGKSYLTMEYQDGTWTAPSPWTALDVQLAQVIRDDNGVLHAAAYGENSSQVGWDQWFYDAYYLSYDGTHWSEPLNLSFTDGVVRDLGLAFDTQGHLHFLWSDPDSLYSSESLKSALWERVWDGSAWSDNTEVTAYNNNQAINGFSLTTDDNGRLHLAWSEGTWISGTHTNLDIYYQSGDGTTWGPEEKVYTSTAESRYPVLATGGNEVFLVWQEGLSADSEVYFSYAAQEIARTYLPLIIRNRP